MSSSTETEVTPQAPAPEPAAPPKQATQPGKTKPRQLPPYHVVLLDDQDHTHEYVIEMMQSLFAHPKERGYQIAQEVHLRKKAVVHTTHLELAELKRDQIHAFGTDMRVATCAGSMSACVVKAE